MNRWSHIALSYSMGLGMSPNPNTLSTSRAVYGHVNNLSIAANATSTNSTDSLLPRSTVLTARNLTNSSSFKSLTYFLISNTSVGSEDISLNRYDLTTSSAFRILTSRRFGCGSLVLLLSCSVLSMIKVFSY